MAWVTPWEEDQPLVGDPANQAHIDMQTISKAVRERIAVEHDATDGDDTDTWIHLENSARCDVTIAVGARNAAAAAGRMHFATGTGLLTIDDGAAWNDINVGGMVTTEFGGTGQDFSASTGFIYLTGGTCSAVATISSTLGGTGQDFSSSTGVIYVSSGTFSALNLTMSVVVSGGVIKLSNDEASPGNSEVYGTNSGGTKGWQALTQITMITDAQYDSTTGKFQVKTRTGYVISPGAESAWTDVFTAVECP